MKDFPYINKTNILFLEGENDEEFLHFGWVTPHKLEEVYGKFSYYNQMIIVSSSL